MSGEGRRDQRGVRLFVALDLPTTMLERIERWQRSQGDREHLRPVRRSALHVTLAFLGERPPPVATAAGSVVEALNPGPVRGRLLPEPVPLPRRRPNLLALAVESAAAEALQAELSRRLRALEIHEPDRRPYWPHLTVFRLRGTGRGAGRARVTALDEGDGHAFGFRRIALYRSDLRPEGASYSLLAAQDLPEDNTA